MVEESTAAGHGLNAEATELSRLVAQFTIEDGVSGERRAA
jgi:methyl-accepting chemotaxis protein